MYNMINKAREPHHIPAEHRKCRPEPPHHRHEARHNVLSVVYEQDKMEKVFGDNWPFHQEKISVEPPEMKMLFALNMGFKVAVNNAVMEHLKELYKEERPYRFTNPALDPEDTAMSTIASKLGISEEDASTILGFPPDGVVAIVIAAAKNVTKEVSA